MLKLRHDHLEEQNEKYNVISGGHKTLNGWSWFNISLPQGSVGVVFL
jgi:hypothetical protein